MGEDMVERRCAVREVFVQWSLYVFGAGAVGDPGNGGEIAPEGCSVVD